MKSRALQLAAIDALFFKRAFFVSCVIHFVLFLLHFPVPKMPPDIKVKEDAIKVDIATPEMLKKNKILFEKSPFTESEKPKEIVTKKMDVGSQKVVANSTKLGNPKAKPETNVQKGDPMSKNYTKYKPGTDFRKLDKTNVGTGSRGKTPSVDGGGGTGNSYKSFNFAQKSDSMFAQKGYRFKVGNNPDDGGAGGGTGGGVGDGKGGGLGDGTLTGTSTGTLKRAQILNNVGSLSGASSGKIASSAGAEGLSKKGTIMMAGIPTETVVLGSIDPEIIRQLLRDAIPQFKRCYQSELDNASNKAEFTGVVTLNFVIGASGNVIKSLVTGDSTLTPEIKSCVGNVLKGIQFPQPKGSGNVEVKQPINFYPQRL